MRSLFAVLIVGTGLQLSLEGSDLEVSWDGTDKMVLMVVKGLGVILVGTGIEVSFLELSSGGTGLASCGEEALAVSWKLSSVEIEPNFSGTGLEMALPGAKLFEELFLFNASRFLCPAPPGKPPLRPPDGRFGQFPLLI